MATKAESLLLRQSIRLLDRPEETCYHHLGYWLGSSLQDSFPSLVELGPSCPTLMPRFPLHQAMVEVLQEGLMRQELDPKELKSVTTKLIYESRIADIVPPPKVQVKSPAVDFLGLVFPRLHHSILEPESKDTLFSLVHNIFYNKDRLFRQGRLQDPYCPLQECQGKVQDLEHIFTSCFLVAEAWLWLRSRLLRLLPNIMGAGGTSSQDFLLLQFPIDVMNKECVWLLGNYCEIVASSVVGKKRKLEADQLEGRLKTRLQMMRGRAVIQPSIFNM